MKNKVMVDIENILIPDLFLNSTPSPEKIEKVRQYYKEHGKLDEDIVLTKDGYIVDGYIRYLVIREIDEIDKCACVILNHMRYKPLGDEKKNALYVYGVHHVRPTKEYVWRVSKDKEETLNLCVGDYAIVQTQHGKRKIIVTRIERHENPPVDGKIRRVIACCKK